MTPEQAEKVVTNLTADMRRKYSCPLESCYNSIRRTTMGSEPTAAAMRAGRKAAGYMFCQSLIKHTDKHDTVVRRQAEVIARIIDAEFAELVAACVTVHEWLSVMPDSHLAPSIAKLAAAIKARGDA